MVEIEDGTANNIVDYTKGLLLILHSEIKKWSILPQKNSNDSLVLVRGGCYSYSWPPKTFYHEYWIFDTRNLKTSKNELWLRTIVNSRDVQHPMDINWDRSQTFFTALDGIEIFRRDNHCYMTETLSPYIMIL